MAIFNSYVSHYQRVNLHFPMVFLWFSPKNPDVSHLFFRGLECTELPPYADALRSETKLPVFDAITNADGRGGRGWGNGWEKLGRSHGFSPMAAPHPMEIPGVSARQIWSNMQIYKRYQKIAMFLTFFSKACDLWIHMDWNDLTRVVTDEKIMFHLGWSNWRTVHFFLFLVLQRTSTSLMLLWLIHGDIF